MVVQDVKFVEQSMYQEEGSPSWASLLPPVGTSTPQLSGVTLSHIVLVNLIHESLYPGFLEIKQAEIRLSKHS